jgi:hypothetical protein
MMNVGSLSRLASRADLLSFRVGIDDSRNQFMRRDPSDRNVRGSSGTLLFDWMGAC